LLHGGRALIALIVGIEFPPLVAPFEIAAADTNRGPIGSIRISIAAIAGGGAGVESDITVVPVDVLHQCGHRGGIKLQLTAVLS
jgi:hypothetical protein